MSPSEMNKMQLQEEYERIAPLVHPYFPVFKEYHQRQLLEKIIHANQQDTHVIKNEYMYLESLSNLLEQGSN